MPSLLLRLSPVLSSLLLLLLWGCGGVWGLETSERVTNLEVEMNLLIQQMMTQQLYVEETARNSWDSGIKQIRRRGTGPKSYFAQTHNGHSVGAVHNHANNIRTVGLGEVAVVLNGVEFRTRHNDYRVAMASQTSKALHAMEDIPYPEVPPEVLQKATIDDQIVEMREWFKAWHQQDASVRDYRRHFTPLLCYLEAAWTLGEQVQDPFPSDRHHLTAFTWQHLQNEIRFTSATGTKSFTEDFSFLPRSIVGLLTNGTARYGQWNYRVLCHPVAGELHPSLLHPTDYLASRLPRKRPYTSHLQSRAARFRLESPQDDKYWTLLDDLMYQIPGKDNYVGNLTDDLFGEVKKHVKNGDTLNTAFYHRAYSVAEKDAMGDLNINRGFSDQNLFVAQNSQPEIAPVSMLFCKNHYEFKQDKCRTYTQRVSYAIPLEVVYLTPLLKWNPYDIEYKGHESSELGKTVKAGGKDGTTEAKAMNGSNSKNFYHTPAAFFGGNEVDRDSADSTRSRVYVRDRSGVVRLTSSSGTRVLLPRIPGVGVLRTRYPIMPIATEGHQVWKELEALRDIVLDMKNHLLYFPTPPPLAEQALDVNDPWATHSRLILRPAQEDSLVPSHGHVIRLTKVNFEKLKFQNQTLFLRTTVSQGHHHELLIDFNEALNKYDYLFCDKAAACFDGHPSRLWFDRLKR